MISVLAGFVASVLNFLSGILPGSPFQAYIAESEGLATGLGWLNWFVPVGDCLIIFGAWLTVLVVFVGAKYVFGTSKRVLDGVIGGE